MIAKNPIPPTIWSYNDDITDYEYDPEQAKALARRGWLTPTGSRPICGPCRYSVLTIPNAARMAEMMQADLGGDRHQRARSLPTKWGEYLDRSKER